MGKTTDYPLVIIGAGAAGLAASEMASQFGIHHIILEASHRIGGRGLTEYMSGNIPVDLGCHWMHCADINPYVQWANQHDFRYKTDGDTVQGYFNGNHLNNNEINDYFNVFNECLNRVNNDTQLNSDSSLWDAVDTDSKWATYLIHYLGLSHSADVDQTSIIDARSYIDTGLDWPVQGGYGALIAKQGASCPVVLNNPVTQIDWSHSPIEITTSKGVIRADKIILTVSTGILNAGDILFSPELPDWKQEAITSLPMGNYNNLFFKIKSDSFDKQANHHLLYNKEDTSFGIYIRPFDEDYLFTCTGGRFAWWLENQGQAASEKYFLEALEEIYGTDIKKDLLEFKVSAWGNDPWVKGAYSVLQPGKGSQRAAMAKTINESLYFAGEAASTDAFSTAHGAYLSGHRAVLEIMGITKDKYGLNVNS